MREITFWNYFPEGMLVILLKGGYKIRQNKKTRKYIAMKISTCFLYQENGLGMFSLSLSTSLILYLFVLCIGKMQFIQNLLM